MPLHLLSIDGKVRDEDLTEFSIYIHDGTAKEAKPEDDDAEEIKFYVRPMSGFELERAGNKTRLKKGRGRGDGKEEPTDGTASLDHIAKVLVRMDPAPIDEAGQEKENITLDVVRGLPAWVIMRITEHMDLTRKDQEEEERN